MNKKVVFMPRLNCIPVLRSAIHLYRFKKYRVVVNADCEDES